MTHLIHEDSWNEILQSLDSLNWHEDLFLPLFAFDGGMYRAVLVGIFLIFLLHLLLASGQKCPVHIQPFSSGRDFIGCMFTLEFSL